MSANLSGRLAEAAIIDDPSPIVAPTDGLRIRNGSITAASQSHHFSLFD
jgi:hypothetical protein